MESTKLSQLAAAALEAELSDADRLERIATYCDSLQRLVDGDGLEDFDREALSKLAEQHARIVELAKQLLSGTASGLKELRMRAKGFLAYQDVFEGRRHLMKPKKG